MHTTPSPHPLLRVELLADRQRRWAGLFWSAPPGCADALAPWRLDPQVQALAATMPCVWDDQPEPTVHTDPVFTAPPPAHAHWVRGAWYLAPPTAPGAPPAHRTQALQLLQRVNADADTRELEEVLRADPALTYQLLRLVNAAGVGGGRQVTGFSQALLLLGRQQLQRWLQLVVFAARDGDSRSHLLLAHVVLRARGMETLCKAAGGDRHAQEEAFITGMFSMLGTLFGQPLSEVLRPLALSAPMQTALCGGAGELGALLGAWTAMETGAFDHLATQLEALGVAPLPFNRLLLDSCDWTRQLTQAQTAGSGHA